MGERAYEFGPFAFDMRRRLLRKHGSLVAIGQKSAVLLETLLAARGRAVSKSELIEAAWQTRAVEESNLAVQIAALRKCLGRSRNGEEWIVTVQRVGYQFVDAAEVGATTRPESVPAALATAERPSIAVSPFTSMSGDAHEDYLGRALSEDIVTELTRWRRLSVQSHAASLHGRDAEPDSGQVAPGSRASYIVEGSVRRMNGSMRIAVKLIDAEAGQHVWAERFDCGSADVAMVEDQVVRRIVGTLVGRFEVAATERARRKAPASLAAYECVLQGNALPWRDPAGGAEAMRLFSKAIEIDPDYGFAHALLAAITVLKWKDEPDETDVLLNEAHRLAKRAVALEGSESTCFAILGTVCMFRRSFDVALQHLRRSLEINPNNQWNTAEMGVVLAHADQPEAALACFDRAKQIDPYFDPPWSWFCIGLANMLLQRYREAIAAFDRFPGRSYRIAALMAGCHARLADAKQAETLLLESLSLRPGLRIGIILAKEPFKNPADAAHIAECLEMAGLPA